MKSDPWNRGRLLDAHIKVKGIKVEPKCMWCDTHVVVSEVQWLLGASKIHGMIGRNGHLGTKQHENIHQPYLYTELGLLKSNLAFII